ncbi:hypothetical protein GM415_05585 [Pseudodesulfovibrio cashew]|uniref:Uncharacterized protein n=1 Tax=Pseudodesulfovibrio cashew TaxID=2678688 RepID=A0A6I6JBY9_9BACT|nr:hypothetical protein [Pseudodesulfovibrio cashew]QGY39611.1 hypothetical protein GM415_05585 [Pseudodesulfovibrio cashew]
MIWIRVKNSEDRMASRLEAIRLKVRRETRRMIYVAGIMIGLMAVIEAGHLYRLLTV